MQLHMSYLFTSESVSQGHPDKFCDQVSDAVLDAMLEQDPQGHLGCECLATKGLLVISGEMRSTADIDIEQIARNVIQDVGYDQETCGFDAESCEIKLAVGQQSPDIAQGVDEGDGLHQEQGAGDQGLMFGYACRETPELMPLPIAVAHRLARALAEARTQGQLPYLGPDGKSQVSVQYGEDGKPKRIDTVVISTQHAEGVELDQLSADIQEQIIDPICSDLADDRTKYHINPTGRFVIGGPLGDCGLTGRKIIVDTYGGMGRHGGGAFSGKDPTKVDRSGAYAARWLAKHVVAAGLAERCEVQLAYAIGVAEPVSVHVHTFGTTVSYSDQQIAAGLQQTFNLTPAGIIYDLQLQKPQYKGLAAYGHMGREDLGVSWEQTDRIEPLIEAISSSCSAETVHS